MIQNQLDAEKRIFGWGVYEFWLVLCFFLTWGFVFLDRLTISFLAPVVMEDLSISQIQYGLIGTATTGCYAISAIIFGALSDKSGVRKKWLVPFVLGTSVFSALGAATNTFGTFIITRAMVGFCEGPIIPLIIAMIAKESSANRLALNTSITNLGVAVIALSFGPILVTQVAAVADWRMSFLVASIPTFIFALIIAKFTREVYVEPSADASGKKDSAIKLLGKLFKYRNVLLCFIIQIFLMAGYWTMMLYASLFFSTVGGRELTSVGFILSIMGILGIVWVIVVPKLSDYTGRKPALILWFALAAIAPFAMFGAPSSFGAVVAYCLVAGIPGSIVPIVNYVIPAETLPANLYASAVGLIIGAGELIGGSGWPALSGVVSQEFGLPVLMLVCGCFYVVAIILSIVLKETYGKEVRMAKKAAAKGASNAV